MQMGSPTPFYLILPHPSFGFLSVQNEVNFGKKFPFFDQIYGDFCTCNCIQDEHWLYLLIAY